MVCMIYRVSIVCRCIHQGRCHAHFYNTFLLLTPTNASYYGCPMKHAACASTLLAGASSVLVFTFLTVALPVQAHADAIPASVSIQTGQLLPSLAPGATSMCPQPRALSATSYIFSGSLQSFEVTMTDSSYVAVAGSLGEAPIPFQLMTRRFDDLGNLVIHGDTEIPVAASNTLLLTLLSSSSQATCVSLVAVTIEVPSVSRSVPRASVSGAETGTGERKQAATLPSLGVESVPKKATDSGTSVPGLASSGALSETKEGAPSIVFLGSLGAALRDSCTAMDPVQLWLILLILYAVLAALASLWEPAKRPQYWTEIAAAIVVIPLVLLFGYWYVAENCRAGTWVPIGAVVIALVGLWGVFRGTLEVSKVIPLPAAKNADDHR